MNIRRHSTPLLRSLDAEWARLDRRRDSRRRMLTWPDLVPDPSFATALRTAIDGATGLQDLVDATNRCDGAVRVGSSPDDVLAGLVMAARHDQLAGRVLVQRLLPGVISASRKWTAGSRERTIDHAIGTCWLAIAGFDATRRRRHIAASLISDVIWLAFRQPARRRSSTEIPVDQRALSRRAAERPRVDPLVALARTIRAAAHAGVDQAHLDLVRDLARTGSPSEVARLHHVTPRTIRNRRDVARAEIRAALRIDPVVSCQTPSDRSGGDPPTLTSAA